MTEHQQEARTHHQTLVGKVVSDKMDKTVVVAVEQTRTHPLYRRSMKRTSKFYAHDAGNECREGDRVLIAASRPLSKQKRWRVRQILQRAEG
ncbi:MAG: 30S ribosomal protein S17 [Acidobacteriota bacterium]|nr:30S ribosomal protein S17 [Acidobacteriota bacterium]